jgi:hypothetical protein
MRKPLVFAGLLLFAWGLMSAQSIAVTIPYTGMTCWTKIPMVIRWTSTGSLPGQVRIQLRNSNSTSVVKEIINPTPNDGEHLWTVPESMTPGQYRVRVKAIGVNVYGDSQVFAIDHHPQWTLTAPAAGAKWAKGKTYQITWTNFGPVPPKIGIYLLQGQTETLIVGCVPDSGSYSWTVPPTIPVGDYMIRLHGTDASCKEGGMYLSGPVFKIILPIQQRLRVKKK